MHDDFYKEFEGEKWYSVAPLMFIVSVIPLVVYGKLKELTGDYFKYWNGSVRTFDFFSYYKSVWILLAVSMLILIFAIRVAKKYTVINKSKIYIPMGIYSLFVILSTIFSDYKEVSVFGFVERYEGMLVILAYMAILFIAINIVNDERKIKAILIALLTSAVLIGIIGICQYFNHDLFRTDFGRKMILPAEFKAQASKLKFQFGDKIIYSTLYHYNYVGSYMAMLFPLTFTLFLFIKNKFHKIIMGVVSFLMFLNLILCHSRAGIVGGIVSLLVLLIFIRKFIKQNYKYFVAALAIAGVAFIGFNIYSKGMLLSRIGSLFDDAEAIAKNKDNSTLKDIVINGKTLSIVTTNNTLQVIADSGKLTFKDKENKVISSNINENNGQVSLMDNKYKGYNINFKNNMSPNGNDELLISMGNIKMPFAIYNDNFKFINNRGEEVDLKPVEKWGFEGKEKLGSARGYIWSRSIPLLKHTVILGYGPDTFAISFPQNDYVGKLVAYDTSSMLIDKAHNLYLENALNIGGLGLIALLSIFVMYIIHSFKLYFKNDFSDFSSTTGLAIFTAVCGYLGAGFFNDSVVSVAPVFWVLFGLGVSINFKLNNGEQKAKDTN